MGERLTNNSTPDAPKPADGATPKNLQAILTAQDYAALVKGIESGEVDALGRFILNLFKQSIGVKVKLGSVQTNNEAVGCEYEADVQVQGLKVYVRIADEGKSILQNGKPGEYDADVNIFLSQQNILHVRLGRSGQGFVVHPNETPRDSSS
jgi:hypothetical protein